MASKKPNHVMAFPYGTHAIPLFNVVRRFAIQAPSLTFSFFSTSKSNKSVFGTSSSNIPSNIKPYNVDDGESFTGHPKDEVFSFIKSMVEKYKNRVHSVYGGGDMMIKCLISDTFLYFVGDMADQMGVPWISFWAGGPCSLSAHFHTDLIRLSIPLGPNDIEGREEEPMDFIPGLSFVKIGDLPDGVLFGGWASELAVMLHKMGLALPLKCLPIGPFTLTSQNLSHTHDDPYGCLTWLDQQKQTSVAYISFGTMTTPPPDELAALAEGLEESGVPFIWSLKDHLVSQLPDGFLERTRNREFTAPWTPQKRILKHNAVGVFVTHCGWNSVMESIMAGVPMICRPCFGDQRINCRLVSDVWGIGTRIKDGVFTKEETMKCLDMIFSEEKLREKVGALRGFAKHAVGPKGSSTKNFNTLAEIVCEV
ncbi:hypothetical protein MKW98_014036 [Papaver atlanticum]|uniref:Glycosyltransferase n=1 Tax=Papaver atlanticum TaxID=357466 RepID=A0AAD4SL57_9MAGN|nr:hypothetical protein MKW98_014036 [Papaver atlanticum]